MSIYGVENYGNYKLVNDLPQWMKAERYDYCESFFENRSASRVKKHRVSLKKFFSIMF
jgi:TPP-dependent trihydroxycyclohexane-1,2-dione (THcHDO) dehydratase